MDRSLRKRLEEALREFSSSRDIESSANTQPHGADDLRAYLDVAAALRNDAVGSPSAGAMDRGRQQLLSTLHKPDRPRAGLLPHYTFARVAAAVAGFALLFGGLAGASAAAGGPNIAQPVLDAVGINHAPEQAAPGKEHANQNAFQGSHNAGQGIQNAAGQGRAHANPHATSPNHPGSGAGTAGDNAQSRADQHNSNPHAAPPTAIPAPTERPVPTPTPPVSIPTPASDNGHTPAPFPGRP